MIEKILRTLAEKGEVKAGELKLSPAAEKKETIGRLVAEGLVAARRVGRTELLSLTDAGRARAPAAPPPPRDLGAQLDRIEAALARLEARLGGAPEAGELKQTVLAVIAEVDAARRYGGLVPLPDVRQELRRRGVAAADGAVNAVLEELERDYVIDLSIAQSPTAVADRTAGIERPGRGLAYYVVRRQS